MKRTPRNQGFTLVELLVVMVIIAVLAGMAYPAMNGAIVKARQIADVNNAKQIGTLMFTYASDNDGSYPVAATSTLVFQKLIDEKYVAAGDLFFTKSLGVAKTKAI